LLLPAVPEERKALELPELASQVVAVMKAAIGGDGGHSRKGVSVVIAM
jgi:hypothetical protein